MKIDFTDAELETIAAAMDDYIAYDDPDASPEDLIGGISVEDRVTSICRKIDEVYDSWISVTRPIAIRLDIVYI